MAPLTVADFTMNGQAITAEPKTMDQAANPEERAIAALHTLCQTKHISVRRFLVEHKGRNIRSLPLKKVWEGTIKVIKPLQHHRIHQQMATAVFMFEQPTQGKFGEGTDSEAYFKKIQHWCQSCQNVLHEGPFDGCATYKDQFFGGCLNCHYKGDTTNCQKRLELEEERFKEQGGLVALTDEHIKEASMAELLAWAPLIKNAKAARVTMKAKHLKLSNPSKPAARKPATNNATQQEK